MDGVPRSQQFDDVYFSVEDGLAETRHVFMDGNTLSERWSGAGETASGDKNFVIAETGFGTGLNFLAAWQLWNDLKPKNNLKRLEFISVEKYPLTSEYIKEVLSVWADDFPDIFSVYFKNYAFEDGGEIVIDMAEDVRLRLSIGDANDVLPVWDMPVDAWFLDGFKPSSNPEMWTDAVFETMERTAAAGCTSFATFTAAGFVKRALQGAGFDVRKVKGFGRKREMLVGIYDPKDGGA